MKDGNWTLDLDGPGPLEANSGFYCNMTADPPTTVVYSEDKGVKVITGNNGGTIAQPYVADIRYYPSLDFAKALAMNSANCKQFIEFGCKNAKLLNAGEKDRLGNWVSAGGVYQDYWGGAPPNSESCACGVNNTCIPDKKKKCNCDARSNSWTKDEGFLTATADLPVTQVVFRDVNPLKGSEANFTVGNLYCSGEHCDYYIHEGGVRLRVVPLLLSPSCVTRKKTTTKNDPLKSWGQAASERRDYVLSHRVCIMRCSRYAAKI